MPLSLGFSSRYVDPSIGESRRRWKLLEDRVHQSRRQKNLSVGDWSWCPLDDRAIKRCDQRPLTGVHMKVVGQEQPHVVRGVSQVLPREDDGRDEPLNITLEQPAP